MYDVASDGRFLMIKEDQSLSEVTSLVVVQRFDEDLKRIAPTK
jgi:hypothetical protein